MTITGTRAVPPAAISRMAGLFADYLRPFAGSEARFYLGGAVGIDTLALEWLAEHSQATLTVVVPKNLADQPSPASAAVRRWAHAGRVGEVVELGAERLGSPAYHARNRWMVDRSEFVIGFPQGTEQTTSGTWYTINYAAGQGRPRLIVPIQ